MTVSDCESSASARDRSANIGRVFIDSLMLFEVMQIVVVVTGGGGGDDDDDVSGGGGAGRGGCVGGRVILVT
jgi:hypothetical protein